jgi:ferritin
MIASEKLIAACNRQIGNEMGASMQYVILAAYFDGDSYPELAKFFYRQAEEEREHAMKFVHFVVDIGGKVEIPAIPESKGDFQSAEEAVGLAVTWEKEVTQQIFDLVDMAAAERDYIARRFLDWFVEEQLEEVKTMSSLLTTIQRTGQDRLILVESYVARMAPPA